MHLIAKISIGLVSTRAHYAGMQLESGLTRGDDAGSSQGIGLGRRVDEQARPLPLTSLSLLTSRVDLSLRPLP
jgi:hypothetical protein